MRILYVNTLYSPYVIGGAERVLQTQVEAMQRAGHEVAVLTIGDQPGLHRTIENGVPVWRLGIRNVYFHYDELRQRRYGRLKHAMWHLVDIYNPLIAFSVRTVVQQFAPQVASCHNLPGWSVSLWDALRESGIPIVQVLHDQYLLCASSDMFRHGQRCESRCMSCRALRLPHRMKSRQVDTLVGVSRFIVQKMLDYGYFEGVRAVRTIGNILNLTRKDIPRQPREEDGHVAFGLIGRLAPEKGLDLILDAFCAASEPHWKLLVAGQGEAGYESAIKKKYRHPQIEFLGKVAPEDFFPRIDFTVIPSLWEDTFPSVAFESLVYGKPVLGSQIGGIPEIVTDGAGILFTPGNSAALIQVLRQAAKQAASFRSRSCTIQQAATSYLDEKQWIDNWSEVYAEAIAANHPN